MAYANPDALVSAQWLAEHLGEPGLMVVDATWFPAAAPRDAAVEYEIAHIPGAVYFDIDEIADSGTDLPHMLPDAETFAAKVGALGIGDEDRVVVYDANGGFMAAARVWWMFRVFGHQRVAMVDGGFTKWRKEIGTIEKDTVRPEAKTFTVRTPDGKANARLFRLFDQVHANLDAGAELVVDARNAKRFAGDAPEPWPVDRLGHIPDSVNLPFSDLMDPMNDYVMRSAEEITEAVEAAGLNSDRTIVATCGSGVTAAILALGLHLIGREDVAVYDGSWAEWGSRDDAPAETGSASA